MRKTINLPERRSGLPFSDAVEVNGTVYLSGRLGFTPGTMEMPTDASEEARNILDGFKAVLAQADLTMDDLVFVQVYSPDVGLFATWNAVYVTYFEGPLPARAFLGSGPLLYGARFEMLAVAARR